MNYESTLNKATPLQETCDFSPTRQAAVDAYSPDAYTDLRRSNNCICRDQLDIIDCTLDIYGDDAQRRRIEPRRVPPVSDETLMEYKLGAKYAENSKDLLEQAEAKLRSGNLKEAEADLVKAIRAMNRGTSDLRDGFATSLEDGRQPGIAEKTIGNGAQDLQKSSKEAKEALELLRKLRKNPEVDSADRQEICQDVLKNLRQSELLAQRGCNKIEFGIKALQRRPVEDDRRMPPIDYANPDCPPDKEPHCETSAEALRQYRTGETSLDIAASHYSEAIRLVSNGDFGNGYRQLEQFLANYDKGASSIESGLKQDAMTGKRPEEDDLQAGFELTKTTRQKIEELITGLKQLDAIYKNPLLRNAKGAPISKLLPGMTASFQNLQLGISEVKRAEDMIDKRANGDLSIV